MNESIKTSLSKSSFQKIALFDYLDKQKIENFTNSSNDGSWNVMQVLTHLLEAETGALLYMRKKFQGIEDVNDINWKSRKNSMILQVVLYLPTKFKAPKTISNPEVKMSYLELKEAFSKHEKNLEEFLNNYSKSWMNKAIFKHPFVGKLNILQTLKFQRAHIYHHKRQLKRILKNNI